MKVDDESRLLSIFCDKDADQPLVRTPFYNTRYNEVWSTNGYNLIQVNPKIIVGKYPKGALKAPTLESQCMKKITIEAINRALEACPKVDEEIVIQKAVKCKECEGTGDVYWRYTDNQGHTCEQEFDCPVCNGTGELEPEKAKKTGKQIVKPDVIINIGNAYFFAYTIYKLKLAMDFLNITSAKLVCNPARTANKFVINDDINIVIMPIFFDDNHKCDAEIELIQL